jgi:type IV fimbrial biogenesis protein FimT
VRATIQRGFTLIELMITLTVLGLLVLAALPSFRDWIQNTQIRTATESLLSGLQLARLEAVKRNSNVTFTLGEGTDWSVDVASSGENIQSRPSSEGSPNVTLGVTPDGATIVTFNALGRAVTNADGSASITQLNTDVSTLPADKSRDLQIDIQDGGQIRMCDPNVGADGDPRKC